MIACVVVAAAEMAALWLACGGWPRPGRWRVAPVRGRHARAWPRCDPAATATAAFCEYERPFLEWDEWTRPLRRAR